MHPRNAWGSHEELLDEDYETALENWRRNPGRDAEPDPKFYRERKWTEEEATCFQFYETCTPGTPLSPVFESEDALFAWLDLVGKYWDKGESEDEAMERASEVIQPVSKQW
jgi:hypothetical protein